MSGASGSGIPPTTGVVQNSALSFVATAQAMQTPNIENAPAPANLQGTCPEAIQTERLMPPGLKALCDACCKAYPDQPNPLQVTTRLKYWLGGEDPLDYISMYWNPGKPEEHVPPHWHYISFGLSDLHGDGRVHARDGPGSGYGFELTFRLESAAPQPPLWPAQLCQALARYVFTTGNKLCAGDHISWHRPLEGSSRGRLRHLLVAQDAGIEPAHTVHGRVDFLQIVGCTGRELKAAQRGSGFEVLKLIAADPNCGGAWLVSRPRRRVSAAGARAAAACSARSPLAGVSAKLSWAPLQPPPSEVEGPSISAGMEQQIKDTLQRGLSAMSSDSLKLDEPAKMSTDSFEMSSMERALPELPETLHSGMSEGHVQRLQGVHVVMNAEGASLLPLAIDARVRKGAHFTWRCGAMAVTLCAPRVRGALVTEREPYAARDCWLQVMLSDNEARSLSARAAPLKALAPEDSETESEGEGESVPPPAPPALPLTLTSRGLRITVLPEHHFL